MPAGGGGAALPAPSAAHYRGGVRTRWPIAAALDALCVLAFVVIGRASHHHGDSPQGVATTLWPFAAGAALGWAVLTARVAARGSGDRPGADFGSAMDGITVCVSTVAAGMGLRVLAGQGTTASFVAVSTGFLGATMLGWRGVARATLRRSGARGRVRR